MPYVLYIASTLGAVALFMMMPRHGYSPRKLGALLGAVTLGGLWLFLAQHYLEPASDRGITAPAVVYHYIFSGLAIVAAVRVITHDKPVYAALWFVMIVLASAGLLLVLSAEFMAVAMVIIYGGAILVTYVFVIMLASQPGDTAAPDDAPAYDRVSREPAAAVAVGFVLLALLLSAMFATGDSTDSPWLTPNIMAQASSDELIIEKVLTNRAAQRVLDRIGGQGEATVSQTFARTDQLDNTERVGLDLFEGHPLGLELAGVILLMSLAGAVVIARTRVEASQPQEKS